MTFEQFGLDARLVAAVKAAGYVTPTPIQEKAIPVVLEGHDVLGLAQTGTGKTAAFVLPLLQRLMLPPAPSNGRPNGRQVRALILAPTRELAEQIHEAIGVMGAETRVRSVTIYGGVSKQRQLEGLRRGAEIVVACPGRLLEHLGEGNLSLRDIEVLILDEADRMCDMGFLPDVKRVLKHVPTQRQTLFFSATMPADIRALADNILRKPVTVQVGTLAPVNTVEHALYPVPESQKTPLLLAMLEKTATGRVLIFTRTKHRARKLALDLGKYEYRVQMLQGNMAQNRRQEAITGFRDGKYDILVATDIAARGIDVADVSHVINYDMPDTVDAYTHRIGRTGRAHQTGEAFTFSQPADEPLIRAVERVLGAPIERRRLAGFAYGSMAYEPAPAQRGSAASRPGSGRAQGGGQTARPGQPQRAPMSTPNGGAPDRGGPAPDQSGRYSTQGAGASGQGGRHADQAARNDSAARPPRRRRRRPQGAPGASPRAYASGGA